MVSGDHTFAFIQHQDGSATRLVPANKIRSDCKAVPQTRRFRARIGGLVSSKWSLPLAPALEQGEVQSKPNRSRLDPR